MSHTIKSEYIGYHRGRNVYMVQCRLANPEEIQYALRSISLAFSEATEWCVSTFGPNAVGGDSEGIKWSAASDKLYFIIYFKSKEDAMLFKLGFN